MTEDPPMSGGQDFGGQVSTEKNISVAPCKSVVKKIDNRGRNAIQKRQGLFQTLLALPPPALDANPYRLSKRTNFLAAEFSYLKLTLWPVHNRLNRIAA